MKEQTRSILWLCLVLTAHGALDVTSFSLGEDTFLELSDSSGFESRFDLGDGNFIDLPELPDSLNSGSPVSRGRRSLQQYNPVPLSPSAQQIVNIVNGVIDGTIDPATLGLTVNQIITNIDAVSATGAPLSGQQVSEVSQAVGSSAGGVETYTEMRNGEMVNIILAEPAADLVASNVGRRLLQTSIRQRYAIVGNETLKVKAIQTNVTRILNNPQELSSIASSVVPGATASTFGTYDPAKSPKVSSTFNSVLHLTIGCNEAAVKEYAKKMCNYTLVDAAQTTDTAECKPTQTCEQVGLGLFHVLSRVRLNVTLDYVVFATNIINEKTAKSNAAKIESVVTNRGKMNHLSNQAYRGSQVILS